MDQLTIQQVDLQNEGHCTQILVLLDAYMVDPMGAGKKMDPGLGAEIIKGLKTHCAYLGFFVISGGNYIGLANCNKVFSTWRAKSILNIHDLIVLKEFRRKGAGRFLLQHLHAYAKANDYCKLTLEVREDNFGAQGLYKSMGYKPCVPDNFFWENVL